MSRLTVWTWPYSKRYYLTHPWKWFKELWSNIKAAYMRARYGWCYTDAWECGYWLLEILPQLLRHIANHGCGYPGKGEFDTYEKWQNWLLKTASQLEALQEDNWYAQNEYEEQFNLINEHARNERKTENGVSISYKYTPEEEEINRKYFSRTRELCEEREKQLGEIGMRIFKQIPKLWDQGVNYVLFKGNCN